MGVEARNNFLAFLFSKACSCKRKTQHLITPQKKIDMNDKDHDLLTDTRFIYEKCSVMQKSRSYYD